MDEINLATDNLFLANDGTVHRLREDCMVVDQPLAVEIPYSAFRRLSTKDLQVGMDSLLAPNSKTKGYTSRNISVVQIPGIGMAWATRVCTKLPQQVVESLELSTGAVGADFLFFWSPGKALSSFLTIVEHTRIDDKPRFLTGCDPTPKTFFTDWSSVIAKAADRVPLQDLSPEQRMFAASVNAMVTLTSPRYSLDDYCKNREIEQHFRHTHCPVQLKYSGLKRLRSGDYDEDESSGDEQDENSGPVLSRYKFMFTGRDPHAARRTTPGSKPLAPVQQRTWRSDVPDDIEAEIVSAVVKSTLDAPDEKDIIPGFCTMRLVSKAFCRNVDHVLHQCLMQAHLNAKNFSFRNPSAPELLTRSWWTHCRLPFVSLLTYENTDPKQALPLLSKIMHETSQHSAYPVPNVLPSSDPARKERRKTGLQLRLYERQISTLCPSFGNGALPDVTAVQDITITE